MRSRPENPRVAATHNSRMGSSPNFNKNGSGINKMLFLLPALSLPISTGIVHLMDDSRNAPGGLAYPARRRAVC